MDNATLSAYLENPVIQRQILGNYYDSWIAVGPGKDPRFRTEELVIIITVPDLNLGPCPTEIELDGETVYIVAQQVANGTHQATAYEATATTH